MQAVTPHFSCFGRWSEFPRTADVQVGMRLYELLYIIPATLTDDEVSQVETDIQALIQRYGGTPKESRRLGKFRLTYLIKKVRHGHYVLVYLEAEPADVAKINEALRIHEKVLRHLILRADEAGGQEFNLVQFQEVVVDGSAGTGKRRKSDTDKSKAVDDVKAAAELEDAKEIESKEEGKVDDETSEDVPAKEDEVLKISADELDKKIDAALSEETK